jgi:23S rRNA pseudouridine1911/1915/1917 synthase
MLKKKVTGVKVVFEDDFILVLDKPSGLVVHPDGRTDEQSLVDWLTDFWVSQMNLLQRLFLRSWILKKRVGVGNPHTLDSGRYEKRWGIVNRLDRDTSGLILIAKDTKTFFNLQKQFQDHLVKKEYEALVWGEIDLRKLTSENKISIVENTEDLNFVSKKGSYFYRVNEPVSRHKKDPRIWVCGTDVGERVTKRSAETFFEVVETLPDQTTAIKFFPQTGRTHQLRLHARFLGHPIVGDRKYGLNGVANEHGTSQIDNVLVKITEQEKDFDKNSRLMLHAKSLAFIHPKTGKWVRFESEASVF